MLGSQGKRVQSTHLIQHSDGYMRQPTQRGGKRLGLYWRLACPADSPGTSTSTKFGTMMGSAWLRNIPRNWRLT